MTTSDNLNAYPDTLLADKMKSAGMTAEELSVVSGLSRTRVNDILKLRSPVSPRVAARLGKIFGDSPAIWLQNQAQMKATKYTSR